MKKFQSRCLLLFAMSLGLNLSLAKAESFVYGKDYASFSSFDWRYKNPTDKSSGMADEDGGGLLPKIQDQGVYYTCTRFAFLGALESNWTLQMKQKGLEGHSEDLSERYYGYLLAASPVNGPETIHMIPYDYDEYTKGMLTELGFNLEYSKPYFNGSPDYAMTAIADQGIHPVKESHYPYSTGMTKEEEMGPVTDLKEAAIKMKEVYWVYDCKSEENIKKAKELITRYGALSAGINTHFYSKDFTAFYCDSPDPEVFEADHEIQIVGWDDDFSWDDIEFDDGRKPSKKGAWIIKNSWGYVGENGYQYMPYEDTSLSGLFAVIAETDLNKHSIINSHSGLAYLYDFDNATKTGEYENSPLRFGSLYKANKGQFLKAVNFYVIEQDRKYTVKVYKEANSVDDKKIVYSQSGTFGDGTENTGGRRIVELDSFVYLKKGEKYFVEITLEGEGRTSSLMCKVDPKTTNFSVESGLSFLYYDNKWLDMGAMGEKPKIGEDLAAVYMSALSKESFSANGGDFILVSLKDENKDSVIYLGKKDEKYVGDLLNPERKTLSNATIISQASERDIFAGTIYGEGRVIKEGEGSLSLTGATEWTGGTSVNNGSLKVTSPFMASGVDIAKSASMWGGSNDMALGISGDVDNKGLLAGKMHIAGDLSNNGELRPGDLTPQVSPDNIGEISVAGNFTQDSNGRTEIELGSAFDNINVGKNAELDGLVTLVLRDGVFLPEGEMTLKLRDLIKGNGENSYASSLVIKSNSYSDEFITITAMGQDGTEGFKFKTLHGENVNKAVNMPLPKFNYFVNKRFSNFLANATGNSLANSDATPIYSAIMSDTMAAYSKLHSSPSIRAAYIPGNGPLLGQLVVDTSNPSSYNSMLSASLAHSRNIDDLLTYRMNFMSEAVGKDGGTAFAIPFKTQIKQKENKNTAGWKDNITGVVAGAEKQFNRWTQGLYLGKGDYKLYFDGNSFAKSEADSTFIGWHAVQKPNKSGFYLFGQSGFGKEKLENTRNISAIGHAIIDRSTGVYKSDFDIKTKSFTLGGAWQKNTGRTRIIPLLSLNYTKLERPGFTEIGSLNQGLAISMGSEKYDCLNSKLGFSAKRVYNSDFIKIKADSIDGKSRAKNGDKMALGFAAYWEHNFNNDKQDYNYDMIIKGLADSYRISPNSDSFNVKLGVSYISSKDFNANFSVSKTYGSKNYIDNSYCIQLNWAY